MIGVAVGGSGNTSEKKFSYSRLSEALLTIKAIKVDGAVNIYDRQNRKDLKIVDESRKARGRNTAFWFEGFFCHVIEKHKMYSN